MIERMRAMKYKLLLAGGEQNLLKDFFMNGGVEFQCLSTSTYWEDIVAHMDFVEPDAMVCFYDESDDEIFNRIRSLKNYEKYEHVPIIVITDEKGSISMVKKAYNFVDMTIRRPLPADQMFARISGFLKSRAPEKPAGGVDVDKIDLIKPIDLNTILEDLEDGEKQVPRRRAGSRRRRHILVVDDDRSILKMIKSALEQEYDVTTVLNGRMAEKFLNTKKTDLILLDYEMPLLTGPEVLQRLRKNKETENIPVVFMTGVASRNKIKEVMMLGPQGYLLKPVDMEKLFATLKKILD